MKKSILLIAILFCVKSSAVISTHSDYKYHFKKSHPAKLKVVATMYMATTGQCDKTPLITACGYKINPHKASEHKWIAVSRDLLKKFKYGDKVKLSNAGNKNGIYTIADTMNKRFKNKIDILETKGTPIYKLTDVVIEKV